HGDKGDGAGSLADLVACHLAHGFAVAADGEKKDHKALAVAAEDRAGQDPESSRKVAELRRQHRTHQRSRSGDGGKVMAEDHPLISADKVAAVLQALSRRGAHGIQRQHLGGDELGIKPIAQRVSTQRRHHQPHGADGLAAMPREGSQRHRSGRAHRYPDQSFAESHREFPAFLTMAILPKHEALRNRLRSVPEAEFPALSSSHSDFFSRCYAFTRYLARLGWEQLLP